MLRIVQGIQQCTATGQVIGVQEGAPVDQVCSHGSANALRLPGLCTVMQCTDNAKQAEAHAHTHRGQEQPSRIAIGLGRLS